MGRGRGDQNRLRAKSFFDSGPVISGPGFFLYAF
ncbi:hypothetical protein X474_12530 [Dethiosulfatarculus sandiegensis]|uniref:Uncharacterized protein n=1 Tax=Dethiosulfatarculus sandiegensis TaxID=1429043 RepID=A0A0D2JWK8_9BACT|nr:hypothetical protein X474_12530 [Dethiosulfatarculus sandiegensis]